MKLESRLASHALTPVLLLGLGVLVFHRSGLVHPIGHNSPGSARAAAQPTPGKERSFQAEGVALVDATWPAGPDGVELRPPKTPDSGATVEPSARVLSVDGTATELGAFQGILQDSKTFSDCRIASFKLLGSDGDVIRLMVTLQVGPADGGFSGAYRVLGGTGKFEHATGEGSYREALAVEDRLDTVSVILEGTIRY